MRRLLALAALAALAACGQGIPGFTRAPPANPPSTQKPAPNARQAQSLSASEKAQLETLVRSRLDQYQQEFAQGFSPAQGMNDEITNLQPGTDHRYRVDLSGGGHYTIVGSCDNECTNLDMELIDDNGSVVANDMAEDNYPVVTFAPPANGRYTVRILMQACTAAPCYAGARILTQGAPATGKPI